ncbi:hypothetical protein CQW23_09061 [Capsicum baccatum]|uniref:Wall-associated receptor kinase C-terminal domain-containing protein n=1 Tax=Capsicum baccatum TaxID=33114 RepID=A0A2G2XAX5_CAPBA|nr:hypothetical protein CQW23_09061 [Capsicum baccatum]
MLASPLKHRQRLHTLHNPLYHIPQGARDGFGHLELDLEELDFVKVVVFGLVELGKEVLDFVEVFDVRVPFTKLEEFENGLVYWSLSLGGYEWFGLRHLVELVKDLAIVAMFQNTNQKLYFLRLKLEWGHLKALQRTQREENLDYVEQLMANNLSFEENEVTIKKVTIAAGVALLGWGLSKLIGSEGSNNKKKPKASDDNEFEDVNIVKPNDFYQNRDSEAGANCDKTLEEVFDSENFQSFVCGSIILYYNISSDVYVAVDRRSSCSIMQLPVTQNSVAKSNSSGLFHQLSDRFTLSRIVSEECNACYYRGGMCQTKNATKEFYCHNTYRVAVDGINAEESWARSEGPGHRRNMKVIVAAEGTLLSD